MASLFVRAIAAAAVMALPAAAHAATATTSFQVTANVLAACTVSATNLAFGNYSAATGNSGTSAITVSCVSSTPYTIDLDAGGHGTLAGAGTTRAMAAGAQTLSYNLYLDPTHSTVWATGTGNNSSGTANLSTTTTVYGAIPSGQTSGPGSYTDTVNVTLNY